MAWANAVLFSRNLKDIVLVVAKVVLAVLTVAIVAWKVLPWLLPDDWRVKYALAYQVSEGQIMIERKLHNCDWDSAPLGNKHCHYQSIVQVYNSDSKIVDGTGVEIGAGGTTISYNDGKTWQSFPAADNPRPAKILVTWLRVDD